ncbi:OPT family oligopeptide transporter [Myxococcota bacterium]
MPAWQTLPEITPRAFVLSILLAALLAGANAYMGLFAGMTLSASIPAAVMSMGILRLVRGANILENNIVQTSASAGEALAAGVIFTIPALIMLGTWEDFSYWQTTLVAALGGTIGVLFTIPLRRALILESTLRFPEGIATAEVLKVGDRGGLEIKYILWAGAAGALFKLCEVGFRLWESAIRTAGRVHDSVAYVGCALSPALLAVGYILGLRVGVLVFAGGALNWLVVIPLLAAGTDWPVYGTEGLWGAEDQLVGQPVDPAAWASHLWEAQTRFMGVGAMAVGGLWALVRMRHNLMAAVRTGLSAYQRAGSQDARPRTERDIPMQWVGLALAVATVPVTVVFWLLTGQLWVAMVMAVVMMVAGFLFSAVGGYMAGLVGSANNPISGITVATILISSFLLLAMVGTGSVAGPAAAIMIGAVVSCAAAVASDNMQDLKAGRLVGATPYKQQIMQWLGVIAAALVIAPILSLLLDAYGIGIPTAAHPQPLKAPQATLMAEVARSVFHGGMPWHMVTLGVALAIGLIGLDLWLEYKQSTFRTPVLAVAVGLYLPFELSVPIVLGGVVGWVAQRMGRKGPADAIGGRRGLLVAAGLITGEAVIGILLAIPIVVTGNPRVLAFSWGPSPYLGLVLFVGVAVCFVALARRRPGVDS